MAERADMTADEWHRLAEDLMVFMFVAGIALGVLGTLLALRPW